MEVAELVEVGGATGLAIGKGDGLEEVWGLGDVVGAGVAGPFAEEVDLVARLMKFATVDSVGVEFAWTDLMTVVEEGAVARAVVEAVVVGVSQDKER